MIKQKIISHAWLLIIFGLAACAPLPLEVSEQHISSNKSTASGAIPKPVLDHTPQALSTPAKTEDVYSVVVNDVDLRELLFALSRDASLNIDISPEIEGRITLNAVDQTLPQILDRIATFADIRYRIKNDVMVIEKDSPYFVHYDIGYLNMDRSSQSFVSISTEVATTGVGAIGGSSSGGGGNNNSATTIENKSDYHFWQTLVQNIEAIVYGGDSTQSISTDGENSAEAEPETTRAAIANTSIIANAESGILSIKAPQKKHQEVQAFLDEVLNGAKRQVLIEASIVEVNLSDQYQAGVDWSRLAQSGGSGFSFTQSLIGTNLAKAPVSTLTYNNNGSHSLDATVKLLSEYGNAKVLSTPKLMVLNNQTALLKVVDNLIYFTIDVEEDVQENIINRTFTSEIHSVPVGLVMSVTPQISDIDTVTLNVRPTISRVLRFVEDPNPALAISDTTSLIPEISVREMESVMQINGGDTAIIGGLMQDQHGDDTSGIPGLSKLPWVGDLFSYKNKNYTKSELIIFIRPTIIKQANLNSKELEGYKKFLPENLQQGNTTAE
ncbi:MAG: pilus (MSHA type) biogenesis protein MshL [Porticoccus sp.]|nr:pilus (MSHA type) biogenesis protein MshL [Porticoccus sp.]